MLKKILCISLILSVAASCTASQPSNVLVPHKLPKTISYSDGFKQFWTNFEVETRGLKSLSDYVPSNLMKSKFIFVEMPNGQRGIEGFIQVTPDYFDALAFEELDGYLTYFQEGIYKFKMPFKSLVQMLNVKGIVQIDMPRKKKK